MKRTGYISINGKDVYYKIRGSGIPILIIHGWGVDHRLMSGYLEDIFFLNGRLKYQRIYLDLPGMGKSEVNISVKNADDTVDMLIKFIDLIIPNKDFLLIGESYGGYLARGLLIRKKRNVMGFCLLCPLMIPGHRKGTIPEHIVLEKEEKFLSGLSDQDRNFFTYMSIVQTKSMWKDFKMNVYKSLLEQNKDYLENILNGVFVNKIYDEDHVFEKPVLILTGKQDTEVGYKDQAKIFMEYPRATVIVLDKAGHNLQIEQKKLAQSLTVDWLNRVKTFQCDK